MITKMLARLSSARIRIVNVEGAVVVENEMNGKKYVIAKKGEGRL